MAGKTIRESIFRRDNHKCLKCGSDDNLTLDHIKPLALGGVNHRSNYQTLCATCNYEKGATEADYRPLEVFYQELNKVITLRENRKKKPKKYISKIEVMDSVFKVQKLSQEYQQSVIDRITKEQSESELNKNIKLPIYGSLGENKYEIVKLTSGYLSGRIRNRELDVYYSIFNIGTKHLNIDSVLKSINSLCQTT